MSRWAFGGIASVWRGELYVHVVVRLIGRGLLAALGVGMIQATAMEGCAQDARDAGARSAEVHRDAGRDQKESKGDTSELRERRGRLVISLTGTAFLSIRDPAGRTIQFDSENERYISEIPSSDADRGSATVDPADSTAETGSADAIEIRGAMNGEYRIEVIGEKVGDFGMSLLGFDTAGGVTSWAGSGATAPGSQLLYIVRFSPTPGDSIKVHEAAADSLRER